MGSGEDGRSTRGLVRAESEADLSRIDSNAEITAAVSNHRVRLIQSTVSWFATLLGLLISILAIMQLDTAPVFGDDYPPDWPRASSLALLALVSALSVGLALKSRRQAGTLLLASSPLLGACNVWFHVRNAALPELIVVFGTGSLYFSIPGLFFLLTALAGWPPLVSSSRFAGIRTTFRVSLCSLLLAAWVACGLFASVSRHENWSDFKTCYSGSSAVLSAKKFPGSVVLTARVVFVGNSLWLHYDPDHSNWCVVRVEHRYWGVPWWTPGFAVLRGYFKKGERGEFLVDVRRSKGLLLHFLPIFEPYPCCHMMELSEAAVHLRVLSDGPPKSGVRIIGSVYTRVKGARHAAGSVNVLIEGPGGVISATTDQEGIYDQSGLPAGHYTVQVESLDAAVQSREEGDARIGEAWGATLELRR